MAAGAGPRSYRERMRDRVQRYDATDLDDLVRFRRATLGETALIAGPDYMQWLYDRPLDGGRPALWLFRSKGEIEGFLGVVRTVLQVDRQPVEALWATELFVSKTYQLRGAGAVLLEMAMDEPALMLAFEVTDAAKPGLLRTGWSDLGDVALFVRPIDVVAFSRARGRPLPRPVARSIELGLRAHEAIAVAVNRGLGLRLTEVSRFDERSDAVWSSVSNEYRVIARRDADTLNWRFVDYPQPGRYRCAYLERGDTVLGHAVVRLGEHGGLAAGWVVDFLCAPRWARALLAECTSWLRTEGAQAIYCVHQPGRLGRALQLNGFIERSTGWPLMALAEGIPESTRATVLDASNWFITAADSIVDRPREGIVYAV